MDIIILSAVLFILVILVIYTISNISKNNSQLNERITLIQKQLRDNIGDVESINKHLSELNNFREEVLNKVENIENTIDEFIKPIEERKKEEIESPPKQIPDNIPANQTGSFDESKESEDVPSSSEQIAEGKTQTGAQQDDLSEEITAKEGEISSKPPEGNIDVEFPPEEIQDEPPLMHEEAGGRNESIDKSENETQNYTTDESPKVTKLNGNSDKDENRQKYSNEEPSAFPRIRGTRRGKRGPYKAIEERIKFPEVTLLKDGWEWNIYLEIPDNTDTLEVLQDGKNLFNPDDVQQSLPIGDINHSIEISINGKNKIINLCDNNQKYLIFKLRKNFSEPGRLVNSITIGYYAIVVPDIWKLEEESQNKLSLDSEDIILEGYKVYFVHLEGGIEKSLYFINESGEQEKILTSESNYKLEGEIIQDSSEGMGSLFIRDLPKLICVEIDDWENISTIIVGEEGGTKKRKWIEFKPKTNEAIQSLPSSILNWKSSWFFVRLYDDDMTLIDSMDFRFSEDLHGVRIGKYRDYPASNGYEDIELIFTHSPDCKITYEQINIVYQLKIIENQEETIITIPPGIEYDNINFKIKGNNRVTDYLYSNKRIWWTIIDDDDINENDIVWKDTAEILYKTDFSATTNKVLLLKNCIGDIYIGFKEEKPRIYKGLKEEPYTKIYLRDFSDSEELQILNNERSINLFLPSDEETIKIPLLIVKTKLSCLHCAYSTELIELANDHIKTHIDELFPHLPYEEIAKRYGDEFPNTIYKCGHCDNYVSVDDSLYPNDAICAHISEEHRQPGQGEPPMIFSVITDIEEIRSNVFNNLPHIYKCKLCPGYEWEGEDTAGERVDHLIKTHISDIFTSK